MDNRKSKIDQLLQKYKAGNCTVEEMTWLRTALAEADPEADVDQAIIESLLQPVDGLNASESHLEKTLENIKRQIAGQQVKKRSLRLMRWPYWAAAGILFLSLFTLLIRNQHPDTVPQLTKHTVRQQILPEELPPGGNRATLRLADGSLVQLNDQQSGIVMGDEITYANGQPLQSGKMGRNQKANDLSKVMLELSTPVGGMYQVTLPDGTKVWLNAASSLHYPARFAQHERKVTLKGEAFFEVTKDIARPFKVLSQGQEVQVLGTAFNVNAYPDNKLVKTTLVSGRIKLSNENPAIAAVYLQPGQQSSTNATGTIRVAQVDPAAFTAWKEGLFYFDETPLAEALQQIGRWYDVEVKYSSSIPQTHFYGRIKRDKPLGEVLEVLAEGGLRFKLVKARDKHVLLVAAQP
ncbi:MAG: hypothetical protein K0R59_666 [Sphingobacterium sp.]|nr:hypothetical protein [Sphingobacterium sp.]